MSTLNKVMLIGNLGKDPEIRYMPNGTCVANFSVATKESWKDKNSGEKQEKTSWHQVTCFGKIGEICAEYLKKGAKVYIEGRIQYDKWKDKESGQDKSSTKIIADKMTMLDKKESALNASRNEPEPEDEFNENQDIPF